MSHAQSIFTDLRVYLAHLREKLEINPAQPELFITEPGVGYRLVG
jgi:two-component system KDP operon response regulator KdpE